MTKYQDNFIRATSFIKKLLKTKMVTLLLGHPVYLIYIIIRGVFNKYALKCHSFFGKLWTDKICL